MKLPIADYAPDLPPNNDSGASSNLVNLYPRSKESFGPINGLSSTTTNGLVGQCIGAIAVPDSSGNNYVFAGDSTSLYELAPGTVAWATVNTGFTVPAGDEHWNFALYGNRLLACAMGQNVQSFILGTSSAFSTLAATAPQGRFIATVRDWVMVANTYDSVNGYQPQRVQWCAIDDPTTWPTSGTTTEAQLLAGSQIIPGDQGWITGIVGNLGNADAAVFFEHAIWRVVYQGSPTVFGFYPAEGVRGTPAPKSIAQLGAVVYYLGEDGFYAFDGSTSTPIGVNRVDRTFWATVNTGFLGNVVGAVDPINRLVTWIYPSQASASGVPDSMLVYSWALDKWSSATISAEYIFRSITQGYSLEGLDAFVTPANLDALPYSLDSKEYTGGNILIAAMTPAHQLAFFDGPVQAATADTVEAQIIPGKRARVINSRPLIDGVATVSIGGRGRLADSVTWTGPNAMSDTGNCPIRAEGRYIRARVTTAAGVSFNHLQGCEVEAVPGGDR